MLVAILAGSELAPLFASIVKKSTKKGNDFVVGYLGYTECSGRDFLME